MVPDAWQHQDWDAVCKVCRQALFLVAIAEARLPKGPAEVMRCEHCGRALWYRSNARLATVQAYYDQVLWATQQRYTWTPERPPGRKGRRVKR